MTFNVLRFFGLAMLLTISLPGLWWRMAHSDLLDTPKTTFVFIWTIFNISLVCWDFDKRK